MSHVCRVQKEVAESAIADAELRELGGTEYCLRRIDYERQVLENLQEVSASSLTRLEEMLRVERKVQNM